MSEKLKSFLGWMIDNQDRSDLEFYYEANRLLAELPAENMETAYRVLVALNDNLQRNDSYGMIPRPYCIQCRTDLGWTEGRMCLSCPKCHEKFRSVPAFYSEKTGEPAGMTTLNLPNWEFFNHPTLKAGGDPSED